jgi:hypothetical protein
MIITERRAQVIILDKNWYGPCFLFLLGQTLLQNVKTPFQTSHNLHLLFQTLNLIKLDLNICSFLLLFSSLCSIQ